MAFVEQLALVRYELSLDVGVCMLSLTRTFGMRRELGITVFTQAKHRNIVFPFDDPKSTFRHIQVFHRPDLSKRLGEIHTAPQLNFPVKQPDFAQSALGVVKETIDKPLKKNLQNVLSTCWLSSPHSGRQSMRVV
ncbi:MAG: hypothetical protein WB762_24325 [Candidatus Sulfotelmatobacter sp.]